MRDHTVGWCCPSNNRQGVLGVEHRSSDPGAVPNPEGLGYEGKDDTRWNDCDGELMQFTGIEYCGVYVHVPEQVTAAD